MMMARQWQERKSPATGGAFISQTPACLHIQEQRGGSAALRELPLPLLGGFASRLAVLAPDRERQSAQALLRNFLPALETVSVVTMLEPRQRVVDLGEGLRLHLDQRELDVFLDVGLGALDRV